ncbi:MAG TPA: 6,7-dimethyl-8-ribityllumazine synthase [Xanthomonadales bacterium]|nr:6,7-dimethyl-8-ribityllumazine synthase [Xanthomonadales bacterium]
MKIGIAASRFNEFIVEQLLQGARDALKTNGIVEDQVITIWVPGAFELPLAAEVLAKSGKFDAVITLGTVIRGGTPHFDYVAGECARGIRETSQRHGIPVAFGVLTTDTIEQALERAGTGEGNKGFDAAIAAIESFKAIRKLHADIDALEDK